MISVVHTAYLFSILTAIVVAFQFALALGAPWGEMAMGGKFPGKFPTHMRIAAIIQLVVLVIIASVVLTRAGLMFEDYLALSKKAIWGVVVFCLLGAILNTITPSKKERMLWAPITIALLICSINVALG